MDDDINYMDSAMAYGFGPYPGARRRSEIDSRFDPSEEFYSLPLEESVGLYEEVNKKSLVNTGAFMQGRECRHEGNSGGCRERGK